MHDRTKATAIQPATKRAVNMRDGGRCIFCGQRGQPNAHVIARSQGGLGIEENIITACAECHNRMDNSTDRHRMQAAAIDYLKQQYPGWTKEGVTYNKWRNVQTYQKSGGSTE